MTKHFNQLTEAEQERLVILIEECAEVGQAGCKILRHGYESYNPHDPTRETNRDALYRELQDLMYSILCMEDAGDIKEVEVSCDDINAKAPYIHHQ